MKAVIAGYARTPFHFARKGLLSNVRPDDLGAHAVRGLLGKVAFDPFDLEDVIAGCAYPEGPQGNNVARVIGLLAKLPHHAGGMTVNRFCGSSMQAVHIAAANIEAGMGHSYLCVGVESMSMVPQGGLHRSPNPILEQTTAAYIPMGLTAENVAERWNVSRRDQDAFALHSHGKAALARAQGRLRDEIVPVQRGDGAVQEDGCIRPGTSSEALAALAPAFRDGGTVTAGTSSPLTDGAAALLVTSDDYAQRHGLSPLARVRSFATVGVDPAVMGIGPVPATLKALRLARLNAEQIGIVEINEAFASQALACIRELGLDPAIVNIDGGALALGHPLGATGARITGKAAALLKRERARYALATQCVGGGQGIATILEAV